jgi:hypothetical protein
MAQPSLTRGSGPVLKSPNLLLVFWGQFWTNNPALVSSGTAFFMEFLRGQNVKRLTQYGVGFGQIADVSVVNQPWIGSIDIANSLGKAIQSGWIPQPYPNGLYVFIQDPTLPGATSSGGLGAQHWISTTVPGYTYGTAFWFSYSIMPPTRAAPIQPGMTSHQWWKNQAGIYVAMVSHELYEAFTDPTAYTGWSDSNYPQAGFSSECCDVCDDLLNSGNVNSFSYGFWTFDCYWSNSDKACFLGFQNNWINLGAPQGGNSASISTGANENGTWVLFATAQNGDLWNYAGSTAGQPGGSWAGGTWNALAKGAALAGTIVAAMNTVGTLEVFGINQNGELWHIYQAQPNGAWSGGALLGAPTGLKLISNVAIGQNAPNPNESGYQNLEAFAVGSDNQLHHIWQLGAWKGWSGWGDSLGSPPPGLGAFSNPCVGSNADGRLEVFVLGADQNIWHKWQVSPNSGWSDWQSLPLNTSDGAVIQLALKSCWQVGRNSDGRLELFLTAPNNKGSWNVYHTYQTTPNGTWSLWSALMPLNVPAAVAFQGVLTVVNNTTDYRELDVFAIGSDGGLWFIDELHAASTAWKEWQFLYAPPNLLLSSSNTPAVAVTQNGLAVLVSASDGNIWGISQTQPGGSWGPIILP